MRGAVITVDDRAAYDAALRAGARRDAIDVCLGLVASGVSPAVVTGRLLRPAQRDVGRRWALGGWTVAQEHRATAVTTAALDALAEAVPVAPPGPPVLVACPAGESHVLAAAMVVHLLRWRGVPAEGGATPAAGGGGAGGGSAGGAAGGVAGGVVGWSGPDGDADGDGPRLLALSCSMTAHLPGVLAAVEAAAARGLPVVGGGAGFGADGRFAAAAGVPAWLRSTGELARRLDAWSEAPPVPAPPRAEPLACRRALRLAATLVDDVVDGLLTGDEPDRVVDVMCDAAGWAVELAVAAIRVGRPDVLVEGLTDVTATLAGGHGPGRAVAARFADEVLQALARHSCLPEGIDAPVTG